MELYARIRRDGCSQGYHSLVNDSGSAGFAIEKGTVPYTLWSRHNVSRPGHESKEEVVVVGVADLANNVT